ncbi:hypothetical protein [Kineococcus sp. R86509]|uniref:hypothetical protein n=1 Tax=Kineococcus sp. R86509 TaxID=3093851 RepID=UPI0036D233FC
MQAWLEQEQLTRSQAERAGLAAGESTSHLNSYQQLKQSLARIVGEPIAWVVRAHYGNRHRIRRSDTLLVGLTEKSLVIFPTGNQDATIGPDYVRVDLGQARAIGSRRIRLEGGAAQARWLHLDPTEPPARAVLMRPRTFRV